MNTITFSLAGADVESLKTSQSRAIVVQSHLREHHLRQTFERLLQRYNFFQSFVVYLLKLRVAILAPRIDVKAATGNLSATDFNRLSPNYTLVQLFGTRTSDRQIRMIVHRCCYNKAEFPAPVLYIGVQFTHQMSIHVEDYLYGVFLAECARLDEIR